MKNVELLEYANKSNVTQFMDIKFCQLKSYCQPESTK